MKKISIFDIYDPLYYLIENDSITKDKIFKCLKENNYSSFISSKELINFKNLAIITKFIGYKKDFYYSIPYNLQNKETIFINTSFIKIAKKMQNFKYVFEIYNNSKLPNINSLKNTMFKNPALFFYLNEIEMLYKLFNDSNILNQILIHNDIFRILAYLHEYKNLYYFLRMLKDIRGKTWLYTMLLKYDVRMFDDGINYYSMSTYRKELEMKMWKTKNEPNYSFVESTYKPTFSIPINHKNINIKFNYINNWYFKPIKCELKRINLFSLINDNNLLIDFQNIPYGVFDNNNQAIAYIEIDKDIVSYCNVRKEHLERFDPIFYKWTTKNHLNTNYLHYK